MKKLILLCLILPCLPVVASELTEDYFDMAGDYATFGKYNDAIIYMDKIIQLEPNNEDAKDIKNTLIKALNNNTKSYLTTVNPNIKQAQNFKNQGNQNSQISALSSNEKDFWSMFYLAEFYRDNGNYKNAIIYYQKAYNLKPAYSQTYLGIAKTYIELKDYKNAINFLNKYISYNPNSDIAYALRAEANLYSNDITNAEKDIQHAISIEENVSYLLTEAIIMYSKGDYINAKNKLNTLSKNVQTSIVYKYIGLCDYATKNYANALLNIDKAIILSDDDKELNSLYNNMKTSIDSEK